MSKIDWQAARLDFERGMSMRQVAKRHGCTHAAVRKHAMREGWRQNLAARIERETRERLVGIDGTRTTPAQLERLVDAESTRRAAVIGRHRAEWDFLREFTATVLAKVAALEQQPADHPIERPSRDAVMRDAMREMRFAKLAGDVLAVRQEKERLAFSLDEDDPDEPADGESVEHLAVRIMQIFNAAGVLPPEVGKR